MHTDSLINKYFCNGTIEMENREWKKVMATKERPYKS